MFLCFEQIVVRPRK